MSEKYTCSNCGSHEILFVVNFDFYEKIFAVCKSCKAVAFDMNFRSEDDFKSYVCSLLKNWGELSYYEKLGVYENLINNLSYLG